MLNAVQWQVVSAEEIVFKEGQGIVDLVMGTLNFAFKLPSDLTQKSYWKSPISYKPSIAIMTFKLAVHFSFEFFNKGFV